MTTLALILAPVLALQAVGQTPIAIENDNPETWTLEYPRLIQPYISDYRRCLLAGDRRVTGEADFEVQHRSDLPRCAEERETAIESANAVIANRTGYAQFTPENVAGIFDLIGRIHVARGADLDQQFLQRIRGAEAAQAQYDEDRPTGLVLELRDISVVKSRTDADAGSDEAETEETNVED